MNRMIDEPMPDIVRCEYGMWPASAEPFRKGDAATGIPVAGRGRQTGTAALKACSGSMFSPAGAEKEYTFLKAAGERSPKPSAIPAAIAQEAMTGMTAVLTAALKNGCEVSTTMTLTRKTA